jgi:glycine/D-amino acid oxidase-like deaminating enzyme
VARVCVIEPDPTYAKAATPVATGGCRRLFALPENIRMSQFSIEFLKREPDVQWKQGGYLFVVGAAHAKVLEANWRTQESLGVKVELLDRARIAERFPWMRSDDLALGSIPTACCRDCARKRRASEPSSCASGWSMSM